MNGHRASKHLTAAGKLYPGAWKDVEMFRADRGTDIPDWPKWCFLPLAGAYAIVSKAAGVDKLPLDLVSDVGRLGALAAWRMTQGIYRFDPALYDAITDTPLSGDLPCGALHRLSEWCVYVETPNLNKNTEKQIHGFFAHLEWDANTRREELRLLVDYEINLYPIPLHLGNWPLSTAIEKASDEAMQQAIIQRGTYFPGLDSGEVKGLQQIISPMLSLLLYLCAQNAEIGIHGKRPSKPKPKKTKKGLRLFPPPLPVIWPVGTELGAKLRQESAQNGMGTHASPIPHIRRAHWHGYWKGPQSEPEKRKFELRWLSPMLVATGSHSKK